MDTKIKESLERAKDLLINCGWIQGSPGSSARGFCMTGAIGEVVSSFSDQLAVRAALKEHLPEKFDYRCRCSGCQIIAYNDADGRTKEEILAVFDKALQG